MSEDSTEDSSPNDHLKISKLVFSSGAKSDETNYDVDCNNVIIFVGPNNSGKSASLREINDFCLGGSEKMTILSKIKFTDQLSDKGIEELLNNFKVNEIPSNIKINGNNILINVPDFRGNGEESQYQQVEPDFIREQLRKEFIEKVNMGRNIIRYFTILLNGEKRFELIKNKTRGNLKKPPSNPLASTFRNVEIRNKIDKIIHDEFRWHLYLDHTLPKGELEITFNKIDFPNWKLDDEPSIDFFKKCLSIENFGDGIRVFTGLLIAGMSLPHKIILIDEPEAFLHPPKVRSLGTHLTSLIEERKASLIVSTHSPEFVLGCLDKSKNVTIIRLTFDGNNGTTRYLDSNQILKLTTDPLLKSTETINALFHDSAVVSEYHSDRVFYNEIQNQYKSDSPSNTNDTIFLNTNGKDVIHRIFGPLRRIGIPAAAIYDLDFVTGTKMKNKDITKWENTLRWANVPDSELETLENTRAILEKDLNDSKTVQVNPYKRVGLEHLEISKKIKGEELLSELKKYGIFVVPVGELESWSFDLFDEGFEKSYWVEKVLEKLDSDKISLSEKKIWAFIKDVNIWLTNPDRLGMFSESGDNRN